MHIEFISENNEAEEILTKYFDFVKKYSKKEPKGKTLNLATIEERGAKDWDSVISDIFRLENGKVYIQSSQSFNGYLDLQYSKTGYVYNWAKQDFNLEKFLAECREKLIEGEI